MIQSIWMKTDIMKKGISVYFGEQSFTEIEKSVRLAYSLDYKKVFTSLHLPEVDFKPLLNDFTRLGNTCKQLDMHLMVDVSPKTFSYFSYEQFLDFMNISAVHSVRVDFGLNDELIIKLSNIIPNNTHYQYFKIVLNASTMSPDTFEKLIKKGLDISNIEVCHNFYPRPETGISESFFREQTSYFKSKTLKISAFIAGKSGRRAPVFEGLPTLEQHRDLKSSLAFRHLQLLGVDNIYFGDNNISECELKSIAQLNDSAVALECKIKTNSCDVKTILEQTHTERPDSSNHVIRSQESRLILSTGSYNKKTVLPNNTVERKIGDITIDNDLYKRYAGELQICRKNLKQDDRVNVVGKIYEDNLFLLPYIKQSKKYYFVDSKEY